MEIYNKKRTYEISLWTLQDSFIAVLGDSSSQTRGYINNPQMQLSNDGTLELNFSLPMYIDNGITRKKNNIWEYMTDAVTIAGMRKIKVIFNKNTKVEQVYELIIVKVTDSHEQNMPMCTVHCEGLAFHELGKIGYKISLSSDTYLDEQKELWESTGEDPELVNNIDYWCNKIGLIKYPKESETIIASQWYYKVQMDWTGYEGGSLRKTDKIYEESYISSYTPTLGAQTYNQYDEKYRWIDAERSNIYNLTQTIAQTFGVYCKYEYAHDDNYNITGRTVIFYNNFFDEENRLEFTYPYTTNRITRENDCTDLVTKMYVNFTDSDESDTGYITITNTPVNPTGEDYLLNFDYLYTIGTITDEQYAYIREFSIQVKKINDRIISAHNDIIKRETLNTTYSADLAVLNNAINEDTNQLNSYNALLADLTDEDGKITRSGATMDLLFVSNSRVTFNDNGIIPSSIKIYSSTNTDNELTITKIDTDKNGYATSVILADASINSVKAEYDYYPQLYYNELINTFTRRLARDTAQRDLLEDKINTMAEEVQNIEGVLDELLTEKTQLLKEFEATMGPALREGNWTPEDYTKTPYSSYQFISKINTDLNDSDVSIINKNTTGPEATLIWDSNLDYNEQDNCEEDFEHPDNPNYYYRILLNQDDLNEIATFYNREDNVNKNLNVVFWINNWTSSDLYPTPIFKSFALGAGCELVFCKKDSNTNKIVPAIVLTDLTSDMIGAKPENTIIALATIEVNETNNTLKLSNACSTDGIYQIDNQRLGQFTENEPIYQLRYRIKDYTLFTDDQNLKIKYGDTVLNEFEDYSVLEIVHMNDPIDSESAEEAEESEETEDISLLPEEYGYNITFKPISIIKLWNPDATLHIKYNCSQLSTAIYLDAMQILKENAYPKVTYSIDPSIMYQDFFYTDYNALNRIAFINDHELEFNEVQGYISSISLDLDKPWEDSIEVKNYKNKFEDIFSTIVAQTESMSKSEAVISSVGNVVSIGGRISQDQLQSDLASMTLKYNMTSGTLSIGKKNGILLNNSDGVVSLDPSGIIYASTANDNGDWAWHSAITPRGINAEAITYGTLNLVNVNLGNGALVTGNHMFRLASENLSLSSDTCDLSLSGTFSLNGLKIDMNSNNGTFILDGLKIDMNSNAGTFLFDGEALKLDSSTGITTIHVEQQNEQQVNVGNIIIGNGILQSYNINGQGQSSLGLDLRDGTLSISSKNNLKINDSTIDAYIESIVGASTSQSGSPRWTIPIERISVGRANQNVFITNDSMRLGESSSVFSYSNDNNNTKISKLDLGNSFTYDTSSITKFNLNNILVYSSNEQTFLGWNLNTTDHSLTYTNNNTILSKISPTEFNLNNYLKIDSNGIAIKEPKFTKQALNEHIITFINEQNETNYLLKITSEGLYYSLDAGANWYIVTSELVIPENNS